MNRFPLFVTAGILVAALGIGTARAVIENWSTTAADNTDTNISPEGMAGTDAPSTIDNSYRELIAQVAEWAKQEEHNIYAATVGGTGDAITITPDIDPDSLTAGAMYTFIAGTANTGAVTLNVDSLGAVTVFKLHDQALSSGDIEAGQVVIVTYDGTNFQILNPSADTNESGGSGLNNIVEDTTPELGGDLDTNNNSIVTSSSENMVMTTNGTGAWSATTGGSGDATLRTGSGNIILDAGGAGEVQVSGSTTQAGAVEFYEDEDNGTNFIGLRAPTSVGSNVTFALPSADGTNLQVLTTDGSGNLSFQDDQTGSDCTNCFVQFDEESENVSASTTEVVNNVETFDPRNDAASGIYTPDTAGTYKVHAQCSIPNAGSATYKCAIRKNSTNVVEGASAKASGQGQKQIGISALISMNGTTDTIDMTLTNGDSSARSFEDVSWGAHRIGDE